MYLCSILLNFYWFELPFPLLVEVGVSFEIKLEIPVPQIEGIPLKHVEFNETFMRWRTFHVLCMWQHNWLVLPRRHMYMKNFLSHSPSTNFWTIWSISMTYENIVSLKCTPLLYILILHYQSCQYLQISELGTVLVPLREVSGNIELW